MDRDSGEDAVRAGEVVLVGGGPGDPGLLTVAGLAAIKDADVIAADRLAPLAALAQARPDAEIIDVGKIPRGPAAEQRSIEALLIERAQQGLKVVRFKGGDNFVFGRGGEEWQACAAAGVPVRIIPGVTSAIAAPAAAGIPVTHRSLTQGFTVVTGHVRPDDPRSTVDWAALARTGTSLVIMMGMAHLPVITETLINNGLAADTPAAVIEDGTLSTMRIVRAPLADIAASTRAEGLGAPATIVIGAVAAFDPYADL
ncbi:uroporphyrinogen-III C-methyltransferase [Microlunatus elymi]|uniref:uroporphyrinogen-III C-methyltransferase n=1 Tax=Microlunatus elymi TaxID=2596828 RepID=UPI001D17E0AF|nr:uroporphyrinogen-III C-methyltransferase [Microlunatus elymi]